MALLFRCVWVCTVLTADLGAHAAQAQTFNYMCGLFAMCALLCLCVIVCLYSCGCVFLLCVLCRWSMARCRGVWCVYRDTRVYKGFMHACGMWLNLLVTGRAYLVCL